MGARVRRVGGGGMGSSPSTSILSPGIAATVMEIPINAIPQTLPNELKKFLTLNLLSFDHNFLPPLAPRFTNVGTPFESILVRRLVLVCAIRTCSTSILDDLEADIISAGAYLPIPSTKAPTATPAATDITTVPMEKAIDVHENDISLAYMNKFKGKNPRDRIVEIVVNVIDKGRVVGEGKHDELLKTSDVYKNFYDKQIKKD